MGTEGYISEKEPKDGKVIAELRGVSKSFGDILAAGLVVVIEEADHFVAGLAVILDLLE